MMERHIKTYCQLSYVGNLIAHGEQCEQQKHNTHHTQSQCGINSWFVAEDYQQCM